jgi:hypothetical protein
MLAIKPIGFETSSHRADNEMIMFYCLYLQ